MTHGPGTIGILSGDLTRWGWFWQDMLRMFPDIPSGSQVIHVTGQWIADAVNLVITAMRPEDTWVSILADDHKFDQDILTRLLDHNLPLVAPLVALRSRGYGPSLFHETPEGYARYTWQELAGQRGLLPVDSFGGPMAVIRRDVIDAVGQPFFENMPGKRTAPHEDLYAFSKCRRAGFQPYCDLDIMIGHCIPGVVYPMRTAEGQYGVRIWSHETLGYLLPEPTADAEEAPAYHAYT